jgi:exodeoxyribonuclease VII small subunit
MRYIVSLINNFFMAKKNATLFEDSLAELEKLVEQMEQGDIPLEESLKSFERGIKLTRTCQKALQDAEQKVQVLLEKNGQQTLEPFTDE